MCMILSAMFSQLLQLFLVLRCCGVWLPKALVFLLDFLLGLLSPLWLLHANNLCFYAFNCRVTERLSTAFEQALAKDRSLRFSFAIYILNCL